MEDIPKIQMADIYGQYLKVKNEIDNAIQDVIRSSVFIKGGKVVEFEQHLAQYLQANVICCGNGTDALQIAFMALNLQPGEEVITSPFTFIATVEVLTLLGLKPVFADVCADNFNIDITRIEAAITPRTRAILPIHLFGQDADMESILDIAHHYDLAVVEDAAQSFGTDHIFSNGSTKKSGTLGIIGCTSFFPSKTLGAFGDGGALFTSDASMASVIRSIANHGMKTQYYYERTGVNSRLDSIQAAILEVKLGYIDKYIQARQQAASWYYHHLSGISEIALPVRIPYSTHTFHQYTIRTDHRDALKKYLQERSIPTMVYYPKAIHLQEAYHHLGYQKGDFPVSEKLTETVLSLPMHTELNEEQLDYITNCIINFFH